MPVIVGYIKTGGYIVSTIKELIIHVNFLDSYEKI